MAAESPAERRAFLKVVTTGLGALVAALAVVPGLGFLAGAARRPGGAEGGAPLRVTAVGTREDAWLRLDRVTLGSLWLVRAVEDGPIRAFSTVCPHLGCGVDFD